MNRKTEEKILEEIRNRVFERDQTIKQKQKSELERDSKYEALADLTALSKEEVEQISRQVRKEYAQKRRLVVTLAVVGTLIVLVLAAIIGLGDEKRTVSTPRAENEIEFEESFTDNSNNWGVGKNYQYIRKIDQGRYLFESNKEQTCFWDSIPVDFPARYEITLTSVWLQGKYNEYGFMLIQDTEKTSNFDNIQINGDGSARYSTMSNDKWIGSGTWLTNRAHAGDGETPNIQRLVVNTPHYSYYINDKLVAKGTLGITKPTHIALRNCGIQTVAFDHLKILAIDTENDQPVLLDESFTTDTTGWGVGEAFTTHRYLADGRYYYQANRKDWCYYSSIKRPLHQNQDYEIQLTSIWQKGELADYGLVLLKNNDNYLAFTARSSGEANYAWVSNNEYRKQSPLTKCTAPRDGETAHIHRVRIQNNRFHYFIDDTSVVSGDMPDLEIDYIGVRVCGRQTIAFDDLSVKSLP